jgi:tRNA uridine 5-carboxymethylaminomethyl modification enzyme
MTEKGLKDAIVIGGGHAGIEAAWALHRLGVPTTLVTLSKETIGRMSCNPAIGGLAKGHLVKEVDALGGLIGMVADLTAIQYRRLNERKGAAVRGTRVQSDRLAYERTVQSFLQNAKGLRILEKEAVSVYVQNGRVSGVGFKDGTTLACGAVVVCTGTFLSGRLHSGHEIQAGGRTNEPAANGLSDGLRRLGILFRRFKTGTPPRLSRVTIDWDRLEKQEGDKDVLPFSFRTKRILKQQIACFKTFTNPKTHKLIRENLEHSALYGGRISGIGPRYCPSIEDKVVKFPERDRHTVFLEPEGFETDVIYPNGVSTSMPPKVQEAFLRTMEGLERVFILRPGYAVEYDCIDPKTLKPTLEHKDLEGLFFAGQVCGTSGYEEAAAQGVMAGINATHKVLGRPPFILGRHEAYIGVLIDDLTSRGTEEPYRLFTSRSEYRLILREDNALDRLGPRAFALGLLSDGDYERIEARRLSLAQALERARKDPNVRAFLMEADSKDPKPFEVLGLDNPLGPKERLTVVTELVYEGYIKRMQKEVALLEKERTHSIPASLVFRDIPGLSRELQEKLQEKRPKTFLEAMAISGMTPAALNAIAIHIKKLASLEPGLCIDLGF